MSYEGYEQFLCKNGHLWTIDALMWCYGDPPKCPECGEPEAFHHSVDETNGVWVDDVTGEPHPATVPYPFEVDHYEEIFVPAKTIQKPIYKIPKKEKAK